MKFVLAKLMHDRFRGKVGGRYRRLSKRALSTLISSAVTNRKNPGGGCICVTTQVKLIKVPKNGIRNQIDPLDAPLRSLAFVGCRVNMYGKARLFIPENLDCTESPTCLTPGQSGIPVFDKTVALSPTQLPSEARRHRRANQCVTEAFCVLLQYE